MVISRPWSVVLTVAGGLAVVGAVIFLGRAAREALDRRGHYTLKVAELQVSTPPGVSRDVFLAEVAFQGRLVRETLDRSDENTKTRLLNAFKAHPWVETVEIGDLFQDDAIKLTFRKPTMVVGNRVVDRNGVLLPRLTKLDGLPIYKTSSGAADGPSGAPHPDPSVVKIAKFTAWLGDQVPGIAWQSLETTKEGLVLTRKDGAKAIWGQSKAPEPPVEEKVARLKTWKKGDLDLRSK